MGPPTSPLRLRSTGGGPGEDGGGMFAAAGEVPLLRQQWERPEEQKEEDEGAAGDRALAAASVDGERSTGSLDRDSEGEAEQELVEPPYTGGRRPFPAPHLTGKLTTPGSSIHPPPPPPYLPGSPPPFARPPGLGESGHAGGGAGGGGGGHQHHPLSVSFGPGVPGSGIGMDGLPLPLPLSVLSRTASFLKPAASTGLRLFILFAITWSAAMTTCLGPFFPIYMREKFHSSSMLIGLVFSVTSFSQFVACPVVAPFSHQFSRLAALKTGLAILCAGGLIFGILDHPAGFIFGRILQVCVCVCAWRERERLCGCLWGWVYVRASRVLVGWLDKLG
jgi:hypothetical protein